MESASTIIIKFLEIETSTINSPELQQVFRYVKSNDWPSSCENLTGEVAEFFAVKDSLSIIRYCLLRSDRLVIPADCRQKVLQSLHQSHPSIERMTSLARAHVYWPGMDRQIEYYVKGCEICAKTVKSSDQNNV